MARVASIQNLLGLLIGNENGVSGETRSEMLSMSHRESLYIGQLINDLLLLSQISGPEPVPKQKVEADIFDLIETELDAVQAQNLVTEKKIEIVNKTEGASRLLFSDPHLLKRLFRNLFDNAISFAKSRVIVSSTEVEGQLEITVEDDGPGFSLEALRNYGERRVTRIIEHSSEGRISVGLGSVVIKAIAHIHDAQVYPSNSGSGAIVKICFRLTPPK